MKKTILISSLSLHDYVQKCLNLCMSGTGKQVQIITNKNEFSIPDYSRQGIWFEPCYGNIEIDFTIEREQLVNLEKILRLLKEQPIVLCLDAANNCIHISDAII